LMVVAKKSRATTVHLKFVAVLGMQVVLQLVVK
jgi:hypothetical protein